MTQTLHNHGKSSSQVLVFLLGQCLAHVWYQLHKGEFPSVMFVQFKGIEEFLAHKTCIHTFCMAKLHYFSLNFLHVRSPRE